MTILSRDATTFLPASLLPFIKLVAMPFLSIRMHKFYSQFISSGDLVFDVGAHMGDMTAVFLSLGASVICVEPQPYCARILRSRFGANKKVTIIEKGLGRKEDELALHICEDAPSLSTFSNKWKRGRFSRQNWNKQVVVPITTLDSLIATFGTPTFCKIDVEGSELDVLRGLNTTIPLISFEFTKEFIKDAKACTKRLSSITRTKFNYSVYSEFRFWNNEWLDQKELFKILELIPDVKLCGDIYARHL